MKVAVSRTAGKPIAEKYTSKELKALSPHLAGSALRYEKPVR